MNFLYALINIPLKITAMVIGYKCHVKGIVTPTWAKSTLNSLDLQTKSIPKMEAYDSDGRKVSVPGRMSIK